MAETATLETRAAEAGAPLLEVEHLDVYYGASQILFDLGLSVGEGHTVALLGRNGAGKSTTFKAIAGIAPPRRGSVRLRGREMAGQPPHRIARAGIGYVPEDRQVFPEHSVEDNLLIGEKKGATGKRDWTLERVYDVFPILAGMKGRMAGRLSGGEQQMLTIARTLMGNPDLVLLDEPSEGLAPIIVAEIGKLIATLRGMGVTILMAEQNMHFCLAVATHAAVIDKGVVVYRDTIAGLKANREITDRYLSI
ncbi:ABC transporter ATP-binding protein [Albimonas sp. CAU 1670]|uniref:ABC transporter ATP-binding protein n=1 Tax=Albimonas sp. CAU 1670 TaxID=3032599 RepID=UPI0023DBCD44|nr:ABC transporter ATP-binding protein [Albimonas sp. CAU 1670]MDF2233009.1 ABC transporter ATP-binding protein [Albimonas sp. CAU 1670]